MKRATLSFLIVASASAVLLACYSLGYLHLNYPSERTFPVRGVDVSHHQGSIQWDRLLDDSKISFAFIKASEGSTLRDTRFEENWAASNPIARGAYHFFTFCTEGSPGEKLSVSGTLVR